MASSGVAVDHLAHERGKAEFDVGAMKLSWAGSEHALDSHIAYPASSPLTWSSAKEDRPMQGRKELLKNTRKAAHAWKIINELHLTEEEAAKLRFYIDKPNYTDLHWGMFVPAIKGQGTDEQQKKWLPLAYKMQLVVMLKLSLGMALMFKDFTADFQNTLLT